MANTIGAIAKPDKIQFVKGLPKTRSGKIMRRILRKIASNELSNLGDISTLLNPDIVDSIIDLKQFVEGVTYTFAAELCPKVITALVHIVCLKSCFEELSYILRAHTLP